MTYTSMAYTAAKYIAATSAVLTAAAAVGLWWYQCHLIYPAYIPQGARTNVPLPTEFGMPYEDLTLTTPDDVRIRAYLMLARSKADLYRIKGKKGEELEGEKAGGDVRFSATRPTVIYYHANAGNMGHRLPIAKVFWESMGLNVLMLSYRGYGLSEGKPSEKGLRIDAQTALDYVRNHPVIGKTKVIVYGQSIGGCVALATASRNPSISALILENTPLSLRTLIPLVIPHLWPFLLLPVLTEEWDAHVAVPSLGEGVAVLGLQGGRDELVVKSQMDGIKRLLEGRKRVEWKVFKNGTHNDTFAQPGYFQTVADFIGKEVIGGSPIDLRAR